MTYKIFVPIDGSESALRALAHATKLAQRLGNSRIVVAHAHEEPVIYGEIAVYVPLATMQTMQRAHSESVLESAEAQLKGSGVPYDKEILTGPIAHVLAERAKDLGCDAIVMGTHGSTAIGNMLMGSVATKIVHLSSIPVTLVK